MDKLFFPVVDSEIGLPFYIVGVGIECWQYPVDRKEGFEYPQLFITRRGEGEITINGVTMKLTENTAFYIPAGLPHAYHALTDSWYISWICFSGYESVSMLEKRGINEFRVLTNGNLENMHSIMEKAYYILKTDKLLGNARASVQLYSLMIEFCGYSENMFALKDDDSSSFAEALMYIEQNFAKSISLGELAGIVGVSEQHLCRLFKKRFNMRPMEYITKVRLRNAKELLSYADMTISQIAQATGFKEMSYFSGVFKKYEHISPTEYRKINC